MCGLILFFYPHVMDGGYGWVQMALEGKMLWYTMFLMAAMKIVATSCTLGSGGSGGVFGPSVFIGAMLGGGFGYLGQHLFPTWVIYPYSFVLVGMGGFFAGVAKTPLAAIIMACEMSASYTLLVPLMLVSAIAILLLGRTGLYEKQVFTRLASPAHVAGICPGSAGRNACPGRLAAPGRHPYPRRSAFFGSGADRNQISQYLFSGGQPQRRDDRHSLRE